MRFIVAYQTISDYLDNLCDRSTSLDPDDFRALHAVHATRPDAGEPNSTDYYRLSGGQDDGGYLSDLVETCQEVLEDLPAYEVIAPHLHELADYYCALQVHKHVREENACRGWRRGSPRIAYRAGDGLVRVRRLRGLHPGDLLSRLLCLRSGLHR